MATKKQPAAKAAPSTPVLSLADVSGFTADETAKEFGDRARTATRVFLEQGKLVFHLRDCKLKKGQSIYGLLQSQHGVSQGSIDIACKVADVITALVIPGHVTESRFDEVITFRIAKLTASLLAGKSAVKLTAEAVAAILQSGETAAIGDELECLHEHGVCIAEREKAEAARQKAEADKAAADKAAADAKAKADEKAKKDAEAARQKAEAEAAELRKKLAEAEKAKATETAKKAAETTAPAPTSEESDESDQSDGSDETGETDQPAVPDQPADEDQDEAPAPVVVDGTKDKPVPPPVKPAPPKPTLAEVMNRIDAALNDALALDPQEIGQLVDYMLNAATELGATLEPLQAKAA